MPNLEQYNREIEELQIFLDDMGDLLGQESGFVQRKSELTGSGLVKILTLGSLENGKTSLRGFCRVAKELGIHISESGLHQRLNERAVELLRQVVQLWMSQQSKGYKKDVLAPFAHVHIVDSSEIHLPADLEPFFRGRKYPSGLKVQLGYEYKSGKIEAIELEESRQPDQKSRQIEKISEEGDLVIFDLGYFDQKRFAKLHEKGVYFVSRLQTQAGLYLTQDSPKSIDLLDCVREKGTRGEQRYYLGSKERIPVRLIYYQLPDQVVEERRRKAQKTACRRGETCSKRTLASLEWSFFVTNVPNALLSLDHMGDVYRIRWQIELIFKVWKSQMNFDYVGHWRVERVLAQLYGRILALLLFHGVLETYPPLANQEFSIPQAYQLLKVKTQQLIRIINRNFWGIKAFLNQFSQDLRRFATKTKRRKTPSTLDRLLAILA